MLRLRNQGKTIEEIALELRRSERTVSKQLKKAQAEKEQTDGDRQASQKEIEPLVLEAQKEHHAELRGLIEEWKYHLYTPDIEDALHHTERYQKHPISGVEANHLLFIDFDDTDDPAWVKGTICGWHDANVD